ncbi:hypothetical protein [Paenibacillus sp. 2TAB19]|uniref:hypothetical protein n=1 Tax=Paenibacillus sp. 2TAB19 TaxID=3233003 RepID=UPI003F9B2976
MIGKSYVYALAAAFMSLTIGACYIGDLFFDYSFLGMEMGSERETVHLWGFVSIGLGAVLLSIVMVTMDSNRQMLKQWMVITLFLLCFIQLAPLFLWTFVVLIGEWNAVWVLLIHLLLLVILIGSVRYMRRTLVGS